MNKLSEFKDKKLRQGKVLLTSQTKRWSKEEWDRAEEQEKKMLFYNFSGKDHGRGREVVYVAKTKEEARQVLKTHNENIAIDILFNAFRNNLKVKVIRDCFEEKEVCVGFIHEVSSRKPPYDRAEKEFCFSMMCDKETYFEDRKECESLMSLAPWISQVEIELMQ
jgi:hypothetical protein